MKSSRLQAEGGFQKTLALINYERMRFAAQAAFARELASDSPSHASDWGRLVDEASALVAAAAGRGVARAR